MIRKKVFQSIKSLSSTVTETSDLVIRMFIVVESQFFTILTGSVTWLVMILLHKTV